MLLEIKVIPNASKNEIVGWEENRLKVRIRAAPDKGKANAALIAFLAVSLGIAKSQIAIISGQTNRLKRVKIDGITKEELLQKFR